MKYILLLFTFSLLMYSCADKNNFSVKNNSAYHLDTITIDCNGYQIYFTDIKPHTSQYKKVPQDSAFAANNHTIIGRVAAKGKTFFTQEYYNDLGAWFNRVEVIVAPNLSAKLVVQ